MSIKIFSSVKNTFLNLSKKVGNNSSAEIKRNFFNLSKKTAESQDVFSKVSGTNADSVKKLLGIGTVGTIGTVGAVKASEAFDSTTARQEPRRPLKSTTA